MINVCAKCGLYRVDKTVTGPSAVAAESKPGSPAHPRKGPQTAMAACPHCGHQHPFQRLPLLLIGGASATGKSAILHELSGQFNQAVLLEVDLLWLAEFENPTDGHRKFHETWLRLAKNIGQNGRPVVLFGAGLAVPENIENCVERRYFSDTHYLALVCEKDELRRRLLARPAWRKSGQPEQLKDQLDYNSWLIREGPRQIPPVSLIETTDSPVEASANAVKEWIESATGHQPPRTEG